MKLLSALSFACCVWCFEAHAQAPFNTMDSININNIVAAVLVHGDMWNNPVTQRAYCRFPADSNSNINFAGSLWMSGYDGSGQLHVAAQTYRQTGNDYWPGPLDASGTLSYATSSDWAKIWKVNRSDIEYYQSVRLHTVSNTPAAILTWPAKGNTYAQGNGGAPLTIATDMAPFIDVDHNGVYEPLLGDYPDVPGDQALWWVFSDNGPTHSQTNGKPIQVEVHAMAYGYHRGTLIDNVVYYEYNIINKSPNNYTNFRAALWDDIEVGLDNADYVGFDSLWRMGIGYSGIDDGGGSPGHPTNSYNEHLTTPAVTMIDLPGDAGTNYVPAGSFTCGVYDKYNDTIGLPTVDTQYNNYMRAKLRNGQHITNDFAGKGIQSKGYGAGPDCNYVFTGNPSDTTQWSECACNNLPNDCIFILSTNDFTLNSGTSQKIVIALIDADTTHGCPYVSFDRIRIVADTAWAVYHNPPPPNAIPLIHKQNTFKIYPNPANDKLFMETTGNSNDETITIYNTMGQVISIPMNKNGSIYEMNTSHLPTGLYNILYRCGGAQSSVKFIKE